MLREQVQLQFSNVPPRSLPKPMNQPLAPLPVCILLWFLSFSQLLQCIGIDQIFRSSRRALIRYQIIEANYTHRDTLDNLLCSTLHGINILHTTYFRYYIYPAWRNADLEYKTFLLKILRRHSRNCGTKIAQCRIDLFRILRIYTNPNIEINSRPHIAIQVDSPTADQDVVHPSLVKAFQHVYVIRIHILFCRLLLFPAPPIAPSNSSLSSPSSKSINQINRKSQNSPTRPEFPGNGLRCSRAGGRGVRRWSWRRGSRCGSPPRFRYAQ